MHAEVGGPVAEARTCQSQSHRFRGPCVRRGQLRQRLQDRGVPRRQVPRLPTPVLLHHALPPLTYDEDPPPRAWELAGRTASTTGAVAALLLISVHASMHLWTVVVGVASIHACMHIELSIDQSLIEWIEQ